MEIVKLSVGGMKFMTTKATLLKHQDSMLALMFSENFSPSKNHDGYFYIERDGVLFKYVLTFLRCDKLLLPGGFTDFESLLVEADFYQLKALSEAILEKQMKSLQVNQASRCQAMLILEAKPDKVRDDKDIGKVTFGEVYYRHGQDIKFSDYTRRADEYTSSIEKILEESGDWILQDDLEMNMNSTAAYYGYFGAEFFTSGSYNHSKSVVCNAGSCDYKNHGIYSQFHMRLWLKVGGE